MTKKMAISLPDQVFADLQAAAVDQGRSRSALVVEALQRHFFDLETEALIREWTAAVNDMTPAEVEEELAWANWGHEQLEKLAAEEGDTWEPARDLAG